ncbi:MAG: hypothetical protein WC356_06790 [Candidatus Micrarchaeia archaeon]|jgi:hypothetical protein
MKPETDTAMDYADAEEYWEWVNMMNRMRYEEDEQYNKEMEELCCQPKNER